jgi:hypothetical protein
MSELEKREDSSRYDCMTTEELQEILRKHAHGELETEPDTEELFKIMEVLSERQQNTDASAYRSDEEAFAEFCEHYMPKEKTEIRPKVIVFSNRIFKTVAAVLALVLVLTVGTTITAKAFRVDIWSKFASWTKEFFQFTDGEQGASVANPETEINLELKSLQDALMQYSVTEKLVPTWMPEGYKNKDLSVVSTPRMLNINAIYEKNDERLIIKICHTIGAPAKQVEKSDDLFEIYTLGGIEYYIFSNNSNLQAKWAIGEFECVIIGPITLDEMKAMIDSI